MIIFREQVPKRLNMSWKSLEVKKVHNPKNEYQFFISGIGSFYDYQDDHNDIVHKDAFHDTLQEWKKKGKLPFMLLEHSFGKPVGKWTEMKSLTDGLYVEGVLFAILPSARQAIESFNAGELGGLSIGYQAQKVAYINGCRTILQAHLHEVSLVSTPANKKAVITQMTQKLIAARS